MKINEKAKEFKKILEVKPGDCFKLNESEKNSLFIKLSFCNVCNCEVDKGCCFGARLSTGIVWSFPLDSEVILVNAEANVIE